MMPIELQVEVTQTPYPVEIVYDGDDWDVAWETFKTYTSGKEKNTEVVLRASFGN